MKKSISLQLYDLTYDVFDKLSNDMNLNKQNIIRMMIEITLNENQYLESGKMYYTEQFKKAAKRLNLDVTLPNVPDSSKANITLEVSKQTATDLLKYSTVHGAGLGLLLQEYVDNLKSDEAYKRS